MERLIIIHWNKSTGPIPIIQYPPEGAYPSKDIFLKIWAQHELNKENSLIELDFILEDKDRSVISVIQEFEGEIYFLVLIIKTKSKVSDVISSDILAVITKNLLELINTDKITRAVSEAFNTIKNFNKLEGQDLISFFQEKIKFTILQILRNGVITKNELIEILRNDYGFSTVNIDLLLISFLRENLILKKSLPGIKECYFLINDLSYMRIPSLILPDDTIDEKISKKFKKEIIKFYNNYNCSQEIESKLIVSLLIDNDVYNLIKALRKGELTVNDSLNLLNNREDLFEELLEKKIIFEAKGVVYLFTDIRFVKYTPFYLIKTLPMRYEKGEISIDQYLHHLKLLINPLKEKSSFLDYTVI
ncbi:MAG: hypothetical protein KGD68_11440 [Candidatus Lokiarchaeota archaeon]|nr:hypothetical protein [Candidatus Lokiarchaeota archaeon]